MTPEQFSICEAYKRVFESTDGKQVLSDLQKAYCKRTTFALDPYATAFMEGHREVVLRLEAMVEAANNPESIEENNERDNPKHGTASSDNAGYDLHHGYF